MLLVKLLEQDLTEIQFLSHNFSFKFLNTMNQILNTNPIAFNLLLSNKFNINPNYRNQNLSKQLNLLPKRIENYLLKIFSVIYPNQIQLPLSKNCSKFKINKNFKKNLNSSFLNLTKNLLQLSKNS